MNNMYKVAVLLSIFNGEKYLNELIQSVLNQTGVEVSLLIRDDGSTDSSEDIIKDFNDSRITLYKGDNLKPAKSFLELVKDAPESDYYAYCDQDDVWLEHKLRDAINSINRYVDEPALYMSTYDVVDENLKVLYKRDMGYGVPPSLGRTIVYWCPSGCTMVFNNILRKLVAGTKPDYVRMHDYWTLMTAEAFNARIVCEDKSQLLYRQHSNNVVGINTPLLVKVGRWITSAVKGNNERQRQVESFINEYEGLLDEKIIRQLLLVCNYRKTTKDKLKLLMSREYKTENIRVNLMFKISVLLGVF